MFSYKKISIPLIFLFIQLLYYEFVKEFSLVKMLLLQQLR